MGLEVTVSVAATLPILLTSSNVAVTGLADTDVTCQIRKEGGAFGAKALTGANWTEIGLGWYEIDFTAADLDTLGTFLAVVDGATVDQGQIVAQVVAATQAAVSVAVETCILTDYVFNLNGTPMVGAAVQARLLAPTQQLGAGLASDWTSTTTDANGQFWLTVARLAVVEVVIERANWRRVITIPNASSAALFSVT